MKWIAIRREGPRGGEKEGDEESRTVRRTKMRREGQGGGEKDKDKEKRTWRRGRITGIEKR